MGSISTRRLAKELRELSLECPTGIKILSANDFHTWRLSIEVMGDSLYQGQVFALQFIFDAQYPIASPEVTFVSDEHYKAPIHPHVYSNGHICASILGTEWSPILSVAAVCVTMQSMLASCKKLERPPDNDRYVRHAPKSPKNTRFVYDDDTV
ncbi:UBC-like protein [Sistotremastrum niveocremeum HHB9708]|uniref:UBC-like protein n=1 Tax=Sistotremastrum niveocremeum HHB9708 TaxID=1314777 RepID=A0A164R689_9AGAM|nr:UBC-like protein [Sistotremastrum niveocremeum HHB9708]